MDSGFAQHLDRGFDSTATSEIGLLIATYRYPELVVDSGDPLVIDDKALSGTSSSSKSSTDAMALQTFATPAAKQSARRRHPSKLNSYCHTYYVRRMTMFSFRVDEDEAEETRRWAERLNVDRSELLREALHGHLVRLRAEEDVEAWIRKPMAPEEKGLGEIAEWGPAEDWSDWANEKR